MYGLAFIAMTFDVMDSVLQIRHITNKDFTPEKKNNSYLNVVSIIISTNKKTIIFY